MIAVGAALAQRHRQHRRRADQREDRQRSRRCWPRPARACSRRSAWAATASRLFDPSAVDRAEEERIAGLGRAHPGRARQQRLRPALPARDQPAAANRGEIYEAFLRLRGQRRRTGAAGVIPADRRRTRPAGPDRPLGGRAARSRSSPNAHAPASAPTLLVKVTQASLQDDALSSYIGEQLAAHGAPGEQLVLAAAGSQGLHQPARRAGIPRAAVAQFGCRVGAGAVRRRPELVPAADPLRAGAAQDRPRASSGSGRERRQPGSKIREIASQGRRAVGIQTIAEFVQDAASMTFLFGSGVDYVEGLLPGPIGAGDELRLRVAAVAVAQKKARLSAGFFVTMPAWA